LIFFFYFDLEFLNGVPLRNLARHFANEPQEVGVADASSVAVKYVGLPPSREQPLPEVEVTTPPLHVQGPVLDGRETEDLAQLEAGVQDLRST
jgi:hypothetical protein